MPRPAMAIEKLSPADIEAQTRIAQVFEPDPTQHAIYNELFSNFMAIYKANRSIYHNLQRIYPSTTDAGTGVSDESLN